MTTERAANGGVGRILPAPLAGNPGRPRQARSRARVASSLLLLLLSILPAAATTYHVRKDGSDATCDGTADAPPGGGTSCAFATIQHGAGAAISPGDRVLIHGGTYFESVLVASNGSAAAPITLAGAPGETAVLDAGIPAFRTPGNSDWEPVDPAIGEYRSVGAYSGKRIYGYLLGVPGYENERVTLVPYVDSRDQPGGGGAGFASFRATTDRYQDAATPFYVGPGLWLEKVCAGGTQPGADCETAADCGVGGICSSTGRIRIRLSKTDDLRSAEARYGTVLAEENADPRRYPILLTVARTTLRITGSYLRFENLTVNPSEETVTFDSGSHDVTFDGMTIWRGDRGVVVPTGALAPPHHVTITRSRLYGDFPYWIFWSDSKDPPYPAYGLKGTSIDLRSGAHDWEISYCHIRGGMDGIGTNEFEWNLSAHHNRIENFSDDAFEIEGTSDIGRVDVFENFIANSLEAFAPGQSSPLVTGPIFFYRNVAALLRDPPVNRVAGINTWNGGFRFGGDHAFKQHSPNTFYYQNTVILLNGHSKGMNIVPGDPGEQSDTYVFNNLLVKVNGFVQGDYLTGPGQIVDHNLYWKVNTTDLAPLAGGFDTLAELTAAIGLESSGLGSVPKRGTDPRFAGWGPVFDTTDPDRWKLGPNDEVTRPALFVLQSDSPALGAGRALPVHPRFGLLPDSRASRADLGAIPGDADPFQWNVFPFDQGWPGPAPAMDLVETAVADPPATVAASSGFTAMETLANRGPGRAAASATRFYLSADGAKDPGDVLLGGSRSVPEMGSGESSQGATDLTVPASTRSGPYRLLACADDFSMLPETDETNNCLASAGTIQIPLPDLTESALADPPAAARAGDSITVSDAVTNAGGGASEAFVTSYLLSLDAVKGSGDVSLTGNRPISEVSAGAVSAGIVTVAVPASTLPGLYYLIGCADGGGVVTESNETNNCRSSAGRVQIPLPDLMESAVGDPPPSAPAGGSVTMSDTVLNQGGGAAGGSTTRYYLSLDSLKGSGDILLSGTRLVGGLDAGASGAGSATVAIPSATTVGPYYLLACADDTGAVAETSETDNCLAASQPIQVTKPDLAETAVPDPPATAAQGKAFSVTDTVRNQGAAAAGSSTTRYYLSLDTLKSSADKLLSGTRSISTLAADASSTGTVTVTIPSSTAAGLYYLLACADDKSAVKESDETNNCLPAAGRVQVLVPDLTVAAVSDPPAAAVIGASFSASDTTLNQGMAASASSTTRYYLSLDMLKNSGDKLLSGTRSVPSLLPGAASPGTVTVTIPSSTAAGLYYLLACADDKAVLAESDETNNCRPSVGRIQVTVPDLVESAVSDPPVAVPVGTGFAVTDTALNQGTGIAAISTTRYYLSADTSKGSSDLLLTGSRSVPSLAPGTSSAGTASVTVPAGAAAGLYYLLACADDTSLVTESSNSNNCRASILRVSVS